MIVPTILITGLLATAGVKATAGVSSVIVAPANTPSWASSMTGLWYLEEGTTNTRVSSGTCTTACGLARSGNTDRDSTLKQQGSYSNVFDGTGDFLSCTNANCGSDLGVASSGGTGGSVSWGCWIRPESSSNEVALARTNSENTAGYSLSALMDQVIGFRFDTTCRVNSTSVTRPYDDASLLNLWLFVVCSFDDSANTLTLFFNGASAASGSVSSITSVTDPFYIGSAAFSGGDFDGNIDECFVYKGPMDATDACRICSCGVDGSLCTYDVTTGAYIEKGRNVGSCGSCTLPTASNSTP